MSRKTLQSICIVGIFLIAFAAVIWLGIRQGKNEPSFGATGVELSEKLSFDEAVAARPHLDETSTVYVTKSGTKYHVSPDCSGLRNAKEVIGTPLASAESDGKKPCSICGNG